MILIVGSSHDDVLYLETIIKNKVHCYPLFDKFAVVKGTIFNQNVTIVSGLFTAYVASAVIESLLKDESPLLVIDIGKCKALTPDYKNGDIVVSNSFMALDVDQCQNRNVRLGQIPGFEQQYYVSQDILKIIGQCFDRFYITNTHNACMMSSNRVIETKSMLSTVLQGETVLGQENNIVFDSESFGILIPCLLNKVPLVAIKVVDSHVDEPISVNNFVTTMDAYANVGKVLVSFIGEIGRRDLVD